MTKPLIFALIFAALSVIGWLGTEQFPGKSEAFLYAASFVVMLFSAIGTVGSLILVVWRGYRGKRWRP